MRKSIIDIIRVRYSCNREEAGFVLGCCYNHVWQEQDDIVSKLIEHLDHLDHNDEVIELLKWFRINT